MRVFDQTINTIARNNNIYHVHVSRGKVVFITPREQVELAMKTENDRCVIKLPSITTSGYVILYNGEFTTL